MRGFWEATRRCAWSLLLRGHTTHMEPTGCVHAWVQVRVCCCTAPAAFPTLLSISLSPKHPFVLFYVTPPPALPPNPSFQTPSLLAFASSLATSSLAAPVLFPPNRYGILINYRLPCNATVVDENAFQNLGVIQVGWACGAMLSTIMKRGLCKNLLRWLCGR